MEETLKKTLLNKTALVIAGLIILSVLILSYVIYHYQKKNIENEVKQRLTSIGELKISQIEKWRETRIADGLDKINSPSFREGFRQYFITRNPANLLKRFETFKKSYQFEEVFLVNQDLKVILSSEKMERRVDLALKPYFTNSEKKQTTVMSDFFVSRGKIYLMVISYFDLYSSQFRIPPFFMVFLINPEEFLYPLLQYWPVPSDTAETLLVRKEGESVLFLNELRHAKNTAMKLKWALGETALPAVQAVVSKQKKLVEGLDYRRVPVIAYLSPIKETNWYMVAKIDQKEAFSELFQFNIFLMVFLFFFMAALVSVFLFYWQRGRNKLLLEAYENKIKLQESETRWKYALEGAGDGIWDWNLNTGKIFYSQRWKEMLGYAQEEFGDSFEDWLKILHPADQKKCLQSLEGLLLDKIELYEDLHRERCKDGSYKWVLERGKVIERDQAGKPLRVIGIHSDFTERKKAEEEIQKLNDDLEKKVLERTALLEAANNKLDSSNHQLIKINQNLEQAYSDLKIAQDKLILSEKMAVLGQLISGVAHEMNTPLGAILSANEIIQKNMPETLQVIPEFYAKLDGVGKNIFKKMIEQALSLGNVIMTTAEKRSNRRKLLELLESWKVECPDVLADQLNDLGLTPDDPQIKEAISHPEAQKIFELALSIINTILSSKIITQAGKKAAKTLIALKNYNFHDVNEKIGQLDVVQSLENILTLYYNKIKHDVKITKLYQNVPRVFCYPEKLTQVWVNLINNALQAMNYQGDLEVDVRQVENEVIVSFSNNGPEIPVEIRDKIFLPLFTTKKAGEGTGLGLDICQKILEKIQGRIDFESHPEKTTFRVYLKVGPVSPNSS